MPSRSQPSRRQILALLAAGILAPRPALAAPKAELWDFWLPNDPASNLTIDHHAWDVLLARFRQVGSDGIARFDYAGAKNDRTLLDSYLEQLSQVLPAKLPRGEQFAFWANLYNALTVAVILDHYPVKSIREIDTSPRLFSDGPWGESLIEIDGQALSLDDIEHRILRPIWHDPRIHYAVNCASLGCPDLPAMAFRAQTLDQQLDAAASAFINHPRGARVEGGQLYVSSLYDWYSDDFGGWPKGVIAHLQSFAQGELAKALSGIEKIAGDDYDWALNALAS